MAHTSQHMSIPKLDLEEFHFSPPGSMGWSYAEYEKIVDHDDEKLEITTTSNLPKTIASQNLVELPAGSAVEIQEEVEEEKQIEKEAGSSEEHLEIAPIEEKQKVVVHNESALRVKAISQPRQLFNKKLKPHTQEIHTAKDTVRSMRLVPETIEEDIEESESPDVTNEVDQELLQETNSELENETTLVELEQDEDDAEEESEEEIDYDFQMKSKGSTKAPWLSIKIS
ncbi:hypothetical protein GLW07_09305 [Bacillus hwajinpoensis]|uniref:Uncharacterized protein n=1 Tax=Guptibacillus hwajinpoensis TaxID=208199 RepID=A0A845EYE7_9BACL|nr:MULTISPECIES: hypothetical protein [Bacillaceae]MYL63549.1 hypothetical protein [Pseudalkalibacillus hwajinpoensis]PFG12729.1 hypothetical protein ATG70_0916 [Bacillus sp. es.036]